MDKNLRLKNIKYLQGLQSMIKSIYKKMETTLFIYWITIKIFWNFAFSLNTCNVMIK